MAGYREQADYGEMYRRTSPVLSSRLKIAASMVEKGSNAADIGCDHGKLAVWLAMNRGCPKVVAVDNRPLPLEKAKALVRQAGCGDVVSCRLGSGLEPFEENEVSNIVIAGMSGETMVDILLPHQWIKNNEINMVFVPVKRDNLLRRFLCENGFFIKHEEVVEDGKYVYAVINAGLGEENIPGDELYYQLGEIKNSRSSAAEGYKKKKLKDLQNRLLGNLENSERESLEKLCMEVEKCLV